MTILTIVGGELVAVKQGVVVANIATTDLYHVMGATADVACSSSVDFPEEYTTRPRVLALCREIRSWEAK